MAGDLARRDDGIHALSGENVLCAQNQDIFCAYKEAHLPAPISQYACAEVATAARVNKSCIGESERAV